MQTMSGLNIGDILLIGNVVCEQDGELDVKHLSHETAVMLAKTGPTEDYQNGLIQLASFLMNVQKIMTDVERSCIRVENEGGRLYLVRAVPVKNLMPDRITKDKLRQRLPALKTVLPSIGEHVHLSIMIGLLRKNIFGVRTYPGPT